jgi:XTP/dITP diphosphohydrolase
MIKLLLGTNNPGKIQEMTALLGDLAIELVTPRIIGIDLMIDEDGSSYLENASIKALSWSRQCNLPTLADDSGLEVDILDGAPGILSHRFTGTSAASDDERRGFLLKQLHPFPRPWSARFICAVAIAIPGQDLITTTGSCRGEIIPEELGENGFGYDPIFLVGHTGKTMAELSMYQKNRVSHRARALLTARPFLIERLLADPKINQ